ncbi:MAG: transglutaminase domain-containing protein [Bacilli bacterium]|nr:transglutaminase domain-containing protein [Bacilli bacterium]
MINTNEKIIGNYSKRELKDINSLSLMLPISNKALNNFMHIKSNNTLTLNMSSSTPFDEEKYYQDVITVINRLMELNKPYKVIVKVTNRETFRKSNIVGIVNSNISLMIDNDENIYSMPDYMKEERKLERMIAKVRAAKLSPLESYLAVYDIVKKYKPYKDNDKNPNESRKLKYILDDNNPYIVCAGFTKLLTELLSRVNIPSKYISVMVDTSYEKGMTQEEKLISYERHARNLVKLDDDKYNIHGYYLADSTWDNHPYEDLFINSLLTFDKKKEAKRLEKLDDIDLLMDFHNLDEFSTKIKYFFKKGISHPGIDTKTEEAFRKKTYKDLYLKIMDILVSLDKDKYIELYNKYNNFLNVNLSEVTSRSLETVISNLLIDYAKYIIPLSNNKVELETIFRAIVEVKKEVDWMDNNEIRKWLSEAAKSNIDREKKEFPYVYDVNNPEGYVGRRK